MSTILIDRRARDTVGFAGALATLAGAAVLVVALAAAALMTAEFFARAAASASLLGPDLFEQATRILGLGFAAAALPALPAALAAPFVRRGEPPLRSHAALALVPGCLVAVLIWIAAAAAMAAAGPGFDAGLDMALRRTIAAFDSFVFLLLPLAAVLGAALGGARTPESAAAAAAPTVLVAVCGLAGELAISDLSLAVLLPLLAAAATLAILYAAAPARTVTPWLTGIALAIGMTLLVSTGLFTPTEALALIAVFGIPIGLAVRVFALKQPIGAMLRLMALETAALAAAMAAGALGAGALLLLGASPTLGIASLSPAMLAAGAAGFFAASVLLSPVPVLMIGLPFALAALRVPAIQPVLASAIFVLLALAAVIARAGRAAPPGAGLTPLAAGIGATVFVALAALVAFVPQIALAPVQALLR